MVEPYIGADGVGDGMIGQGDLDLWRMYFGNTEVQLAQSTSEGGSSTAPVST